MDILPLSAIRSNQEKSNTVSIFTLNNNGDSNSVTIEKSNKYNQPSETIPSLHLDLDSIKQGLESFENDLEQANDDRKISPLNSAKKQPTSRIIQRKNVAPFARKYFKKELNVLMNSAHQFDSPSTKPSVSFQSITIPTVAPPLTDTIQQAPLLKHVKSPKRSNSAQKMRKAITTILGQQVVLEDVFDDFGFNKSILKIDLQKAKQNVQKNKRDQFLKHNYEKSVQNYLPMKENLHPKHFGHYVNVHHDDIGLLSKMNEQDVWEDDLRQTVSISKVYNIPNFFQQLSNAQRTASSSTEEEENANITLSQATVRIMEPSRISKSSSSSSHNSNQKVETSRSETIESKKRKKLELVLFSSDELKDHKPSDETTPMRLTTPSSSNMTYSNEFVSTEKARLEVIRQLKELNDYEEKKRKAEEVKRMEEKAKIVKAVKAKEKQDSIKKYKEGEQLRITQVQLMSGSNSELPKKQKIAEARAEMEAKKKQLQTLTELAARSNRVSKEIVNSEIETKKQVLENEVLEEVNKRKQQNIERKQHMEQIWKQEMERKKLMTSFSRSYFKKLANLKRDAALSEAKERHDRIISDTANSNNKKILSTTTRVNFMERAPPNFAKYTPMIEILTHPNQITSSLSYSRLISSIPIEETKNASLITLDSLIPKQNLIVSSIPVPHSIAFPPPLQDKIFENYQQLLNISQHTTTSALVQQ